MCSPPSSNGASEYKVTVMSDRTPLGTIQKECGSSSNLGLWAMGPGHALLVRTEIRIINSLFWEQTHLGLIRSAKPQVCLGPWNCNTPVIQQIWQKKRDRQGLRSANSWNVPLAPCCNFSSKPIAEVWWEIPKPLCSHQIHAGRGIVSLTEDCFILELLWYQAIF